MTMLRRLLLSLVVVSCFIAACGGGGDKPEATPAPTETPAAGAPGTPEGALAAYSQQTFQKEFVFDCAAAVAATDAGKICATFKGDRDNLKAYTIGQVASEGIQWVILQNNGGKWDVASVTVITPDNAAVPGVPWPLRTGVDVLVTGTGNGLNVRTGPGLQAAAVDRIDDGTVIRLSAGPAPADNLQWWQVEGRSGWVVGDYLRYPDAAGR